MGFPLLWVSFVLAMRIRGYWAPLYVLPERKGIHLNLRAQTRWSDPEGGNPGCPHPLRDRVPAYLTNSLSSSFLCAWYSSSVMSFFSRRSWSLRRRVSISGEMLPGALSVLLLSRSSVVNFTDR